MNPRISSSTGQGGSVLMVTLFSAVLIGTVLASYLTLIRHQDIAVARSQGWNAALAMAEAGVEEALAQINSGDLSANDWGPPVGGIYNLKSRTLSGGSYHVKYFVTGPTNPPVIYSTGYVTIPALSVTVTRSIVVSTKAAPVVNMGVAVGARNGITYTNIGGLATDSFDSADPANNGRYPTSNPSKQSTNGGVATVSGSINFGGNLNIRGDLFLGPTVGVPSGTVSGKTHTDFNADYPDINAPAGLPGPPWTPKAPDTPGPTGKYLCQSSGRHIISDGLAKIIVDPGVEVELYVDTPTFNPAGISVLTNGFGSGKLKIYQPYGTATFRGSGFTAVQSERAEHFQYFGMAGVTSVTYEGGYNFYGVIYAPSAKLALNGGWNSGTYNRMNFVGAAIGKSIVMNGYYTFHFDENLLRPGVSGGGGTTSISYVANSWKEDL